jgi:hypothetical protein
MWALEHKDMLPVDHRLLVGLDRTESKDGASEGAADRSGEVDIVVLD